MKFKEIHKRLSLSFAVPATDVRDFIDDYINLPKVAVAYKISNIDRLREVLFEQINTALVTDGYACVFPPFTKLDWPVTYTLPDKKLEAQSLQIANDFLKSMGCKLPKQRIKQDV